MDTEQPVIWPIVMWLCLRRLRNEAPHLFDGKLALESIARAIADDGF